MLLNILQLEKVSHQNVSQAIVNSSGLLRLLGLKYDKVLLALSDAGSYMLKSMAGLKDVMFTKMIHVTCAAHGLHRVAESIRVTYTKVDKFIVDMIFVKSPMRRASYIQETGIKLPPEPVVTRWGTSWLDAVFYYAETYDVVKKYVLGMDTAAQSMQTVKTELKNNHELKMQIAYILCHFKVLASTIKILESQNLTNLKVNCTWDA